jgi:putative flippase GtrA
MLKYHGSEALGAVVNYATLVTLTTIGLHLIVANTIGIFLGFISNYLLSETFVWKWR